MLAYVPYIPPAIPVKRQTCEIQQVVQSEPYPYYYKDNDKPLPWWVFVIMFILAGVLAYVGRFK